MLNIKIFLVGSFKKTKGGDIVTKKDSPSTLAKKLADWINTDEGKKSFEDSTRHTEEILAQLEKSRQIDWRILHIPCGPIDGGRLWPHQRV